MDALGSSTFISLWSSNAGGWFFLGCCIIPGTCAFALQFLYLIQFIHAVGGGIFHAKEKIEKSMSCVPH